MFCLRKLRFGLAINGFLFFVLTFASPTAAQTYTVTDIGTLGGTFSTAVSINDYGEVVGYSSTLGGQTHAFLYLRSGTLLDIDSLGSAKSFAAAITNSGVLIGEFQTSGGETHPFLGVLHDSLFDLGEYHLFTSARGANNAGQVVGSRLVPDEHGELHIRAFLYTSQAVIDLGTFGGKQSDATAINDSGQVVGHLYTANHGGNQRAVLYSAGKTIELGTLGGGDSIGVAINNTGQVVGYSRVPGGDQRAFLYADGRLRNLGTFPGGTQSFAYGINKQGQVVGSSDAKESPLHAFIYNNRSMQDLNQMIPSDSGWVLTEARAINDVGQIVGYGIIKGAQHAFLLTPTALRTLHAKAS
jgi:probable HAF family extracellular repeat protein